MTTKICSKCRQEKPLNEFYKNAYTSDGCQSWCKECMSEFQRQRSKQKPTTAMITKTVKICSKCRKEKPASEFHKDCGKSDGLHSSCKECVSEYQRQHREKKLATTTTLTKGDPSYSHLNDREVQEQVKSLLNELRTRGWQVECSIAYLHTKKL